MKQHPEDRAKHREGARNAAERAFYWCLYQMWHPDYGTTSYYQAWKDYKAGIPIADVYFARRLTLPTHMHGMPLPEETSYART